MIINFILYSTLWRRQREVDFRKSIQSQNLDGFSENCFKFLFQLFIFGKKVAKEKCVVELCPPCLSTLKKKYVEISEPLLSNII